MIKTKKTIAEMKALERGVTILADVLSADDIIQIQELYHRYSDKLTTIRRAENLGKKNNIINVPDNEFHLVDNIINSKLNLLPFLYESINFYTIQNPYHLHSDTGKNNNIGYQQGVIPLSVLPANSTAYTVIFNERVYFSSEYAPIDKRVLKSPSYEPFYNIGTWDTTYYEGWADEYRISDDDCKLIWGTEWEHWKDCYKGFSINTIYKWKVGDILLFDRSLLHASSLLHVNGVDVKSGLLFLTYR